MSNGDRCVWSSRRIILLWNIIQSYIIHAWPTFDYDPIPCRTNSKGKHLSPANKLVHGGRVGRRGRAGSREEESTDIRPCVHIWGAVKWQQPRPVKQNLYIPF